MLELFGRVSIGESTLSWKPSPWRAKACSVGEVSGDSFTKRFDRRTEACPAFAFLRPSRARQLGFLFGCQFGWERFLLWFVRADVELVFHRSVWTQTFGCGGGVADLVCGDDLVRV